MDNLLIDPRHPIETGMYRIFTPAMDKLARQIAEWIKDKVTGAYIFGYSRLGKSSAVEYYLRELLSERFGGGPVPLMFYTHDSLVKGNTKALWDSIIAQNNISIPPRTRGGIGIFNLLLNSCVALARNCGVHYVALIVDEAQELSAAHWRWLKDFETRLGKLKISLMTYSIASHQLKHQQDVMARTDDYHIAARMFEKRWAYPGIESVEEIEFVLQGYDMDSEWPVGGPSYFAYYAPHLFASGKRLAQSAKEFWEALMSCLPKIFKSNPSFPMKHIARAVERQLQRLAAGDDWDDVVCVAGWESSLRHVDLPEHMKSVSQY